MNTAIAPRRTLIDAWLPGATYSGTAALVLGGSLVVALSARITIPLPLVPITAQPYAVLLVGALLGSRRGALALLTYLGEGLLGLPVFAGGASAWSASSLPGTAVIVGPTAGYLWAYPLVALVVGALAERGWDRTMGRALLAMALGIALIYGGGVGWLAHYIGLSNALLFGAQPFIVGDALKAILAAATLPGGWWLLARLERAGLR